MGSRFDFTSRGYIPQNISERSASAFRLISGANNPLALSYDVNVRAPPHVVQPTAEFHPRIQTYGAVPNCAPTASKPFSGIWVGDYNGHGNEFVAFLQPDDFELPVLALEALPDCGWYQDQQITSKDESNHEPSPKYKGSIVGVKLTGDSNVPRGEYTFIVPHLNRPIRIADERTFNGATVVGGLGHIAGRGFHQDKYISAQMFLISPDRVAMYWEELGHISYFVRAKFDGFLGPYPKTHIPL